MLFYLLSAEELAEILTRLDYPVPSIPDNIEYYLQRTSHGSTLSSVVHAWVLACGRRHQAMEFFGGTTGLINPLGHRTGGLP
ncbi:trehalose/maltose hydrolase-like predicted phosphorylase [Saccharopolyspora phatthalungensis]|uniref:Trehalose/maltose hydrolase-like predicted phosphorylase n=1 Tax=Saccharopolyspora phatthalungensis TaxID=664693 RepID=A0A840Q6B1_9PSEU|nr:trehalose/maltose hydrolase-like predicted phosphorylase [Saccharopolyspora phatthalungensis]